MTQTRCPGNGRHWFSFHGQGTGRRSPVCVRCLAPNPRWTADDAENWTDDAAEWWGWPEQIAAATAIGRAPRSTKQSDDG